MVVKARVVVVHPADQPDLDMLIAEQLLVDPGLGVVLDQVLPDLGPEHQVADEPVQLRPSQIAVGRGANHAATTSSLSGRPSRRAGLVRSIASAAASPSRSAGGGATTGRSRPRTRR